MVTNTTSTYMPEDPDHRALLVNYDHSSDIWISNAMWRFLSNHAFTGIAAAASVKLSMFLWSSMHFSFFGMIGAGVSLITIVAEIHRNHGLLAINDSLYSSFGFDYLATDVKHINNLLNYFESFIEKHKTTQAVNVSSNVLNTNDSDDNEDDYDDLEISVSNTTDDEQIMTPGSEQLPEEIE